VAVLGCQTGGISRKPRPRWKEETEWCKLMGGSSVICVELFHLCQKRYTGLYNLKEYVVGEFYYANKYYLFGCS